MDFQALVNSTKRDDNYINATKWCQAFGKEFKDFKKLKQTKDLVTSIAASLKVTESHLMEVKRGKGSETWVHPLLAIALAKWLAPKFHTFCLVILKQYFEGDVELLKDIINRIDDLEKLKEVETAVQQQKDYLKAHWASHDELKLRGCQAQQYGAYNKAINQALAIEDGTRPLMDEETRVLAMLGNGAAYLELLRNPDATGWKAATIAKKAAERTIKLHKPDEPTETFEF